VATVRVQHVVTGGPGGEVAYVVEVVDGKVSGASLGADDTADLTLAEKHGDAAEIVAGELAPDDAFMRGRVKVTGSMGTYMALVPVFRSEAYRAAQASVTNG
jgi:putative sterol carrier protein